MNNPEQHLPSGEIGRLKKEAWRVYQLTHGYIRHLRERKAGASLVLHDSAPACGLTEDELDTILNDDPVLRFNVSTFQR
jgi:hypothetical protein